jgi:predicted protein tyrosine phosphatase
MNRNSAHDDIDVPPVTHPFQQRLFICGADETTAYQSRQISHLLSIANPGAVPSKPPWFKGTHLPLWFGDVISEADATLWKTSTPKIKDIQQAVEFFRDAWRVGGTRILVSCDYGASRSPALAYLFIADELGVGHEAEAFSLMLAIRPLAVPNELVVRLGDTLLRRGGALLVPLKDLYTRINAELFPKKA